ncbi:MAG: hypothetical protein ACSHX8_13840 [Opitutaceae bacterium]
MKKLICIISILIFTCLVIFTPRKIFKMAQIRGFIDGPPLVTEIVTDKGSTPGTYSESYLVCWNNTDINIPGKDRIFLPHEFWSQIEIGQPIKVMYFPNSKFPSHREGIFASNENFVFDFILLAWWSLGIGFSAYIGFIKTNNSQGRVPPPIPNY